MKKVIFTFILVLLHNISVCKNLNNNDLEVETEYNYLIKFPSKNSDFYEKIFNFVNDRIELNSKFLIIIETEIHFKNNSYKIGGYFYSRGEIDYIIIDKRLDDNTKQKVFIHELIHLHQKTIGDLILKLEEKAVIWKNKQYLMTDIDYFKRAWEIEAHKLEKKINREYRLHEKRKRNSI